MFLQLSLRQPSSLYPVFSQACFRRVPSIQAPSLRLFILGVKHVPGVFPGNGRRGGFGLGASLLVSAAHFCGKSSLEMSICAGKGDAPNLGIQSESAEARSMCVLGDRPTLVKIFTRSCIPILYHSDHCSANASRVPLSHHLYLLILLCSIYCWVLGCSSLLLRQAFSNTQMTSKVLLPQVGDTPICVGFAESAGPRGCSPILMNSLQAWMALLTNIMCAVPIFTVHGLCSAFSRAGWPVLGSGTR